MESVRLALRHFGAKTYEYYLTPAGVVAVIPRIVAADDETLGRDCLFTD